MKPLSLSLFASLALLGAVSGAERPFLHPLFTDHMVLQRGVNAPVWGWTTPGAKVTVQLDHQMAIAKADEKGRWMVRLGPFKAGGPFEVKVSGPSEATLKDVLIGDVWLCSGQSNMEWPVSAANNPQVEIAAAKNPKLRLFTVPKKVAVTPQSLLEGAWQTCTPETIPGFSAVGYFFGRELQAGLDVPIGLIHSSWGGTIAEAWTSAEALDDLADFRDSVAEVRASDENSAAYSERKAAWWSENDPGSSTASGMFNRVDTDIASWPVMALPQAWEVGGFGTFDGVGWFRRVVTLTKEDLGKDWVLELGPVDDEDTTWVNGVEVGTTANWMAPRQYTVPASALREGQNVIAVRVLDTGGGGGFVGDAGQLKLRPADGKGQSLSLAGFWHYQKGKELSQMKPMPQQLGSNPNVSTVLYNGMIAPLLPFAIEGAIWYQGESNASRATQYQTLLPTMINDWRTRFGVGAFPFLIVQLANFMNVEDQPGESDWAELREAQSLTAARDPHVGLALAIDIGEANDIHPRNKQEVGRRLALAAGGIAYDIDVVYSGPVYRGLEVKGNAVELRFDHIGGGLVSHGEGPLKGFAIAGADKKFVWANAEIVGDRVRVSADGVPNPVAVRYAWANNPVATLYNKEGLPAEPFRTDVDVVKMPAGYQALFDGNSLAGFKQINGTATYEVKDGTILGTTVAGSPNSFLCTEKHYGDFELQFEVKLLNDELNSGVQIRSNSLEDYQNGRVHGYQVEIATNGEAGFIYDEARRGWLSLDRSNEAARAAYKSGQWNHYRVLAVGDTMKTWINGVPVANVVDDMTKSGFIGLQVHGVAGDPHWQVAWRNLWIREIAK